MVRKAEYRKRRYEKGIDAEVIGKRFEQVKPVMVELESEYLAQIAHVEAEVKAVCEAAGVPTHEVAQYINVGRQCYSIAKRFSQATRDAEAQNVVDHWAARGLDGPLLAQACLAGGCNVVAPPAVCFNPCAHGMEKHTYTILAREWEKTAWFNPLVGDWYHGAVLADFTYAYSNPPTPRIWASYYPIFRRIRFDRIGIWVGGAGGAGALCRLGLYRDNNWYPGGLVFDAGTIDATVIGERTIAIDQTLDPDPYWIVFVSNDNTVDYVYYRDFLAAGGGASIPGLVGGVFAVQAYGPLPDPFPAGGTRWERIFGERMRVAQLL